MEKNNSISSKTNPPPVTYPWWWTVGALILLALPICSFSYLGLGDYGRHLATSFIMKKLLLGDPFYQAYFEFNPVLQPYILVQIILVALSFFLDIEVAGRVMLIFFIFMLPLCTYIYEKSVRHGSHGWWPLSLCLVYTWHFNMGFLPYLIGLLLTLLSISYFYVHTPIASVKEAVFSGLLLLLCFLSHLFAFGVAGLVMLALNFPFLLKRVRFAGLYVLSLAPSLILLGNYAVNMISRRGDLSLIKFSSILDGFKHYLLYTFYSYYKLLDCLLGLAVLCIFGVYLALNYKYIYSVLRNSSRTKERALVAAWLLLILFSFIFPFQIGPLFFTNARLTPFILLLGIPLLKLPAGRTVILVISLIVTVQVAETFQVYSTINRRYQAVAQTIDLIEPHSEFMPIVAHNNIDQYHMEPYSYFWVYYLIDNNSVGPCLPAGNAGARSTNSPLIYKKLYDKSPGLWPLDRQHAEELLAERVYEYVLLWQDPSEAEERLSQVLSKHYAVMFRSDELTIGQRKGDVDD